MLERAVPNAAYSRRTRCTPTMWVGTASMACWRRIGASCSGDEDFAGLYCRDNGRPSVPPSLLATALVLQTYDWVSDEEARRRAAFDLQWKVALGVRLGGDPLWQEHAVRVPGAAAGAPGASGHFQQEPQAGAPEGLPQAPEDVRLVVQGRIWVISGTQIGRAHAWRPSRSSRPRRRYSTDARHDAVHGRWVAEQLCGC